MFLQAFLGCALLRPTGSPNGSVFQWFAQRVWRGFGFFFNGLPNGSGGVLDFFSMVCPTGLEGFRFSMVCPTGLEGFRFSMVCPTGLGGFRIFFQWSAQRARGDSFLSTGSPNGSGGVSFFFQWSAQRVWRGFVFQWSAQRVWRGFVFLPNGSGGVSFFNGLPNGPGGGDSFLSTGSPNGSAG